MSDSMPGMPDEPPTATPSVAIDELAGVVELLRHATAKVKEWESAADELRRVITERLAEAEVGTIAGQPVVKHTLYVSRRVSTKRVRELAPPDLVAACSTKTVSRRFTLVEPDGGEQS